MLEELRHAVTRPWTVMEVCGGQTHAIASLGLEELLPPGLRLIHGPGCPVCVTSVDLIDQAVELSLRPGVVLCSYGDMMRVPGSRGDLFSAKARGGDVLLMYSPLEAVAFAGSHPEAEVVFFAVGFETTAPATALAMQQARALGGAHGFLRLTDIAGHSRNRRRSQNRQDYQHHDHLYKGKPWFLPPSGHARRPFSAAETAARRAISAFRVISTSLYHKYGHSCEAKPSCCEGGKSRKGRLSVRGTFQGSWFSTASIKCAGSSWPPVKRPASARTKRSSGEMSGMLWHRESRPFCSCQQWRPKVS